MRKYFAFFILLMSQFVLAQTPDVLTIRKYGNQNAGSIINEFTALLSLPNVAADTAGQQKTAAFIMAMMNKRAIQKVQLLNAAAAGAPPAIYGEVMVPGAKQTLIFYAHYDGQPVNPAQWAKGCLVHQLDIKEKQAGHTHAEPHNSCMLATPWVSEKPLRQEAGFHKGRDVRRLSRMCLLASAVARCLPASRMW